MNERAFKQPLRLHMTYGLSESLGTYISDSDIPLAHISRVAGLLEHGLHQVQSAHPSIVRTVSLEVAVHRISVAVRP